MLIRFRICAGSSRAGRAGVNFSEAAFALGFRAREHQDGQRNLYRRSVSYEARDEPLASDTLIFILEWARRNFRAAIRRIILDLAPFRRALARR